ncbi:MAG: DUF427 domain-containing protein [Pseudonocardiales bacterium]
MSDSRRCWANDVFSPIGQSRRCHVTHYRHRTIRGVDRLLFETGLPTRYYLPADDVRTGLLTPTDTTTECAYKGTATYGSMRAGGRITSDLAWTYPEPKIEAERVRGYVTFFNERVDVDLDGERQLRAESEWTESAVVALPSAD